MAKLNDLVFPAHAGMNRQDAAAVRPVLRVPRACGDEPVTSEAVINALKCSPRMRG